MRLLGFAAVLLILGAEAQDPELSYVKQVTTLGGASRPMFLDERYLYFMGHYSPCEHIYRMDLENLADGPSLVSTGIGHERMAGVDLSGGKRISSELWISSTARASLADYQRAREIDANARFAESSYCAKDKCSEATSAEIKAACDQPHILRDENTDAIRIYPTGRAIWRRNVTEVTAKWATAGTLVDDIYVHSAQCDVGECILVNDQKVNSETRWSDGFTIFRREKKGSDPQSYKLFYSGAVGPVDEPTRNGVHIFTGAKIYTLDITKDSDGKYKPGAEAVLYQSDKYDYLWPSSNDFQSMQLVVTRVERATGRRVIVMLYMDPEPYKNVFKEVVLTDPNVNSWQASVYRDNFHLAFISDRNGKDDVYIAKLSTTKGEWKTEKTTATRLRLTSTDIKDPWTLVSGGNYELGLFRRIRVFNNRDTLIETTTGIFHHYVSPSSARGLRRISSGANDFESPNYLDKGILVYAGSLRPRHEITHQQRDPIPDDLAKLLMNAKRARPLPKDYEIFKTNALGIITEQMTANDVYDGEVRVSPDAKSMVFSRRDSDYDWWKMTFGGETAKLNISNSKGFEFDAAFSSDSKLLLYATYRPNTDDETKNYEELLKHDYVDIPRSNIYLFDFETNTERLLYDCKDAYCWQPTFYAADKKVLFLWWDPTKKSTRFISFNIETNFSVLNITQFDDISQSENFAYAFVNKAEHSTNTNPKPIIMFGGIDGFSFGEFVDKVLQPTEAPPPPSDSAAFKVEKSAVIIVMLLSMALFIISF